MRLTILNQRTVVVAVLCAVLVVWLGLNPSAGAQGRRIPKRTGHINDFAAVIDGPAKQRLEKVLENLQEKTGIDFVVTTVKTSGNEDLYDYSLRVASSWNVGPASREDSVLLVVASDSANFLTHVSSSARAKVSDAVISETGKSLREQIGNSAFSAALTAGVKTFVDQLGAKNNFSFASLDPQGGETLVAVQERPRKVESPSAQPSENPQPTPAAVPTPGEIASPQASPEMSATPLARPSETAAPVASSPSPSVMPTETPAPNLSPSPAETPAATPAEVATAQPSPSASAESLATNSRSAKTSDKKSSTTPANPEDEKEEVELTLTLPLDKRIEALKAFIAAHPTSVALPRANELIVMAHALLGEQKLQAGDNAAGLQQFRLAISDAPADMPDRLFSEVIARIPLNLFFRGQRDVAFEMARQAETLAKPRAKRLLALAEFYLAVENADEAARLAEAALQLERDLAQAHQALAAARHIALRLDEAESEYARALRSRSKICRRANRFG